MSFGKEQIGKTGIEFHGVKGAAEIYPEWEKLVDINKGEFEFSTAEPLEAYASACTIAVLEEVNGRYGVYHSPYHRKDDMRKYKGHSPEFIESFQTLEDFLRGWRETSMSPTQAAYLFANSFYDDISEVVDSRQQAIYMVKDLLKIKDQQIVTFWNDFPEGETLVIVDPPSQTIHAGIWDLLNEDQGDMTIFDEKEWALIYKSNI